MQAALNIASPTLPGVMPGQLEFTPSAAAKVAELIVEEGNPNLKLRLYVTGGGCSGFPTVLPSTTRPPRTTR